MVEIKMLSIFRWSIFLIAPFVFSTTNTDKSYIKNVLSIFTPSNYTKHTLKTKQQQKYMKRRRWKRKNCREKSHLEIQC